MFYVSLLEQNTIKKERMNKFAEVPEFDKNNNKEYKMEAIQYNIVYAKEAYRYLPRLYYLIA